MTATPATAEVAYPALVGAPVVRDWWLVLPPSTSERRAPWVATQ